MWELVGEKQYENSREIYRTWQRKNNIFIKDVVIESVEKSKPYIEYFKTDGHQDVNESIIPQKYKAPVHKFKRFEVDRYEPNIFNEYEYDVAFSEEVNNKLDGFLNILTDNTETINYLRSENDRLLNNLISVQMKSYKFQKKYTRILNMDFWKRLKFLFKGDKFNQYL